MRRSERFDVGERPRLDVHVPSGSVDVRVGPAGVVHVEIDNGDTDVTISQVGDSVSVRQSSKWGFRSRSVRLVATVPPGTEVEVATASADMRLTGRFGPARLRTASGRIEADVVERLELTSASGDARLREVLDDCHVQTVSGDCQIGEVGGRLTASLVSGDLRAGRVGGDLRAGTTSGDVRVECCGGAEVSLKSVSGDVELGLPSGIRVDADLSTLSGRASLPPSEHGQSAQPRRPVRLAVRTVSGDVTIRRARS